MKKEMFILCSVLLWSELIFSQSEILIDGHWMQSQLLNPASMKTSMNDDHLDFSMIGRKQWMSFPGSPTTYMFDGALYAYRLHAKFGIQAVSDKIGFTCQQKLYLNYAYNLPVGETSYLRMGLAGGFYFFNHDLSTIDADNTEDPSIKFMNDNDLKPDFNLGVEYAEQYFSIGATIHQFQEYFSKNNLSASNYAYAKYKYEGFNYFNLLMGTSFFLSNRFMQGELHTSFIFKDGSENETWWVGGTYRTASEWNANLGLKITPSISVNYTFGYHFGQIRKNSVGTHEIILNYSVDLMNALCPTCRK